MIRYLQKMVLGTVMLLVGALHADNWPSVNFDQLNTRNNVNETILSKNNVGNLEVLWETPPLPGLVNVTPIVVDGVVYFGDTAGNLYAKDVVDGTDVYGPINLGAPIDGPVTVVGDTLYATVSNDLKLFAFNLNLTVKVAFNGGSVVIDPASVGLGQVYAGPVVVENILIIPITSNPVDIYFNLFPTIHGGINAFNATTGEFLWKTPITAPDEGAAGGAWSTPAIDTVLKRIYIGTTNALSPPAGDHTAALLSLNYLTGEIVWSKQYTENAVWGLLNPCGKDYDIGASPNLFRVKIQGKHKDLVGVGSKAGVYRVFERLTGKKIWEADMIPQDQFISINGNPSAAYANNTVFTIANYDTSGLPINVLNMYLVMSNPVVQAQAVVQFLASFSTYDHTMIRAFDAKKGELAWSDDSVGSTLASITYANEVLYTGNFNGVFRALRASDGTSLYTDTVGAPISSPITVVDGRVFVAKGILGPGFSQSGGTLRVYALPTAP